MAVARRWPAVAAAAVLAGCAWAEPAAAPTPAGTGSITASPQATARPTAAPLTTTPAPTGPPAPTTTPAPTGRPGPPQDVVTGLDVPWSVAVLPDRSALVTLRDEARVVRVAPDGSVSPVAATGQDGRVPGVQPSGEGGLLGVAVAPTFEQDRWVYLYFTAGSDNRLVRSRLTGAALGPPEVLLAGIPASLNHNGGRLAFGPDGMLYVSTGDAQQGDSAQNLASLGGKILRLAPDGTPAPGNPFPGSPVWSLGLRNVQGMGWDAQGRMFASEFGANQLDELNLISAGGNYGWPEVEGPGGQGRGFVDPLLTWTTQEASPSGLLVSGDAIYLAALRGERLWRVPLDDGRVGAPEALLNGTLGRLRDVVLAPSGDALWVLTNNTARGVPRPGDDRLVRLGLS